MAIQSENLEKLVNKDTDGTLSANSDTKYPSQKAVKTYVDALNIDSVTMRNVVLNIVLNAFRIAQQGSLSLLNMVDQFVDEYENESGVDTANSINESYDSTDDFYKPTGGTSVSENPYTHFKCNDNATNTTVTDNGSGANNGTANVNTSNYSVTGKINQAFEFNGTSEYINVDNLWTDIKTDTTGSFAFWLNMPSYTGGGTPGIISFARTSSAYEDIFNIIRDSNNKIGVSLATASGTKWNFLVNSAISVDTWYHIALVHNGTTPIIYINGVEVAITFTSSVDKTKWFSSIPNADNGRIACVNYWGLGNIEFFAGKLDDFRYYQNQALSESDASAIYNGGSGTEEQNPPSAFDNMTLISNSQVAESVPTDARIVIFEEDVNSITINTDLKAYVSRDGGTTFSEVTLEDAGNYVTLARILTGTIDISGQPSGTNIEYKLTTHNNKNLKIHGTAVSWK